MRERQGRDTGSTARLESDASSLVGVEREAVLARPDLADAGNAADGGNTLDGSAVDTAGRGAGTALLNVGLHAGRRAKISTSRFS